MTQSEANSQPAFMHSARQWYDTFQVPALRQSADLLQPFSDKDPGAICCFSAFEIID